MNKKTPENKCICYCIVTYGDADRTVCDPITGRRIDMVSQEAMDYVEGPVTHIATGFNGFLYNERMEQQVLNLLHDILKLWLDAGFIQWELYDAIEPYIIPKDPLNLDALVCGFRRKNSFVHNHRYTEPCYSELDKVPCDLKLDDGSTVTVIVELL